MKKFYRILILLVLAFALYTALNLNKVQAASATISGSRTVTQGESVTVTGSVTAGAWNLILSGNGQSKSLVGQTSVVGNQSASTSITFTASNVGTYTFTLSGDITDFNTDATTYPKANCVITVVPKSTPVPTTPPSGGNSSGNAGNTGNTGSNSSGGSSNSNNSSVAAPTLSNLGITPHDFSGFSSAKTAYTVNVPNDCTSVNLYATSKNGTVSGTGTKTLKEGTNKFSVTVTNSAGSKTYTVSIVRASASSNDVPNVVDVPVEEEPAEGIGLSSLEIAGYTLDKEFKTDEYSYSISVSDEITQDYLDELKEKVTVLANSENVNVEILPMLAEDGTAVITIVVKDSEKEYAKYVINVVKEEVEEGEEDNNLVIGAVTDTSSNNNGGSGFSIRNIPFKYKMFIILGAYGITFLMAVAFAFIAYWKSKELAEYEYDNGYDDVYNTVPPLEELGKGKLSDEVEIASEKLGKTSGYRSLRNDEKMTNGRHF